MVGDLLESATMFGVTKFPFIITRVFRFSWLISVGIVVHFDNVSARSTGAPFESCLSLTPQHGGQPTQPISTCPFVVNATKHFDDDEGKEMVNIFITSTPSSGGVTFRGFVAQARYANNPDIIVDGEFLPNENVITRTYSCKINEDMTHQNTWTHRGSQEKQMVTAVWIPPEDLAETVIFQATIVMNRNTFWENVYSKPLPLGSLVDLKDGQTLSNINATTTKKLIKNQSKISLVTTESMLMMFSSQSPSMDSDSSQHKHSSSVHSGSSSAVVLHNTGIIQQLSTLNLGVTLIFLVMTMIMMMMVSVTTTITTITTIL